VALSMIEPIIYYEEDETRFFTSEEKLKFSGEEYAAGYIASKLQEEDLDFDLIDHTTGQQQFSWVRFVSKGGLVKPSNVWLQTFKKFNEYFQAFHHAKVNKFPRVVKDLTECIKGEFPEIPEKIIKFYAKTRTSIRIRHLNKCFENEKYRQQEFFYEKNKRSKNSNPGSSRLHGEDGESEDEFDDEV